MVSLSDECESVKRGIEMKKVFVLGGVLTGLACLAVEPTVISVPAGETVKVDAGSQFEGGVLVKSGAGTLDLSAAVLRNRGLEIREGAVAFSGGAKAAVTCRYVRWKVTQARPAKSGPPEHGNSGSQFSEFRLFRGGRMLTLPAQATALGGDWAEGPKKGIDGNLKTKCYSNPFVADFGQDVTFDGYSFATANDAIGRDPYSWTLEAGFMTASGLRWIPLDAVEKFEAPKARFAEAGKVFPVTMSDVVPAGYPVTVCGKGRLILRDAQETLEALSGTGLVQLEDGATLAVGSTGGFTGSVCGNGKVDFLK